ncbi:TPA: type VI secretion system tip protein VgrG, partial [Escherichia coli]|nr:type VI secretion system tip protein VgrG [Escherichia coli]
VRNDRKVTVEGKQEHKTTGNHISLVEGKHSLEVKGDLARKITGALGMKVRDEIVLESGGKITLKVGGSFVVVHSGGVDIAGPKINLNGGGSAGTPVGTMQPGVLAALADDGGDEEGEDDGQGNGDSGDGEGGAGDDDSGNDSDNSDDDEKEIVSISWSYGNNRTKVQDTSRHYVDLNLHVQTKGYSPGESVSVEIKYDDFDGMERSLAVSGTVDESGEMVVEQVLSGADVCTLDE